MFNIVIGLLCLMISNMILNLTLDKINESISLQTFLNALFKSAIIFVSSLLIYYAGYKNPDILVINMDGVLVNLDDALKMVYIGGIVLYGYKSITKLGELLNVDVTSEERVSISMEEASEIYPDEEIDSEIIEEEQSIAEVKG